jgi:hypothetical protein
MIEVARPMIAAASLTTGNVAGSLFKSSELGTARVLIVKIALESNRHAFFSYWALTKLVERIAGGGLVRQTSTRQKIPKLPLRSTKPPPFKK